MVLNSKLITILPNLDAVVQLPSNESGLVLHEKARRHYWEGTGWLSVKSFFYGQAFYNTGKGLHAVNDSSYLVLNHGQPYSITIESELAVESFCIFFKEGLAEDVYNSLHSKPEKLLDCPLASPESKINFFDKTYPHDKILSPALLSIKSSFADRRNQPGWLEEQMHRVMQLLLKAHQKTCQEALTINAVRPSTREELYRRLFRSKDFIVASFDQPITLKEMAGIACLSPNHFLRSFRQAFRQTPHQFLTSIRLEHARKMLSEANQSITEICFSVGFESLGSFSRLFRRHTGFSPEQFRRLKR
jgi:AraC-like DNA-binding protein